MPFYRFPSRRFKSGAGKVHELHTEAGPLFVPACNVGLRVKGRRVSSVMALTCGPCVKRLEKVGGVDTSVKARRVPRSDALDLIRSKSAPQ